MASSQQGTVQVNLKIDISPDGIKLTMEGIDSELASLIQAAGTFSVATKDYRSFDSSDVVILSDKAISFVPKEPVVP